MCSSEDRTGINELKSERSGIDCRKIRSYRSGTVRKNWSPFPRKCLNRHWWSIAREIVQVTLTLEHSFEDEALTPCSTLSSFQKRSSENNEAFCLKLWCHHLIVRNAYWVQFYWNVSALPLSDSLYFGSLSLLMS